MRRVALLEGNSDEGHSALVVVDEASQAHRAPKHLMPRSKEERGGSLRARSGAPDYTYKSDSEAEPRSRYAATAHPEMTAPNPSRCLHLALAQLLSSRDRLAGLAPVFMSPMPACASERASNRHNHRHT